VEPLAYRLVGNPQRARKGRHADQPDCFFQGVGVTLHTRNVQPNVVVYQQPHVVERAATFGSVTSSPSKQRFAERLHELCNDKAMPVRGRTRQLAKTFEVSQQAASKWLGGLSYPELDTVIAIAEWGDVSVNWLLQGVGLKREAKVSTKAQILEEAIRSLPPELGTDLIDNLRTKLERIGRLTAQEPPRRYKVMLDAFEKEIVGRKGQH
jgi:transcriptional regulator with XRE-family HTH domain